jgi:hypothetical protein
MLVLWDKHYDYRIYFSKQPELKEKLLEPDDNKNFHINLNLWEDKVNFKIPFSSKMNKNDTWLWME